MGRQQQQEGNLCPVLRPTQKGFELPFCDYVREVFLKHPDWPCFKVRGGGDQRLGATFDQVGPF